MRTLMLVGILALIFLFVVSTTARAEVVGRSVQEADMDLTFPDEILIEKGWSKYVNIIIENTGDVRLNNLKINILGEEAEWFDLQQESIASISVGKDTQATGKVFVPYSTASGNYQTRLLVECDELSYEKDFTINVFSNRDDMLLYELKAYEDEINGIEDGVDQISNANTTYAKNLIYEARSEIRIAEQEIKDGAYTQATQTMRDIESNLIKLRFEVSNPSPLIEQTSMAIDIPFETIALYAILCVMVFLSISLIYLMRKIKIRNNVRLPNIGIKDVIVEGKKADVIEKEVDKIVESQRLLEDEYKQGIISKQSYDELKLKYQEKLLDLETQKRKLRGF